MLHQTFPHHAHAQIPEIALLYRQTFFWQMAAKSQNNRGKNAGTCLKASLKRFFTLYIPWKSSCFDTDAMSLFFWTVSKKTQIYNYCLHDTLLIFWVLFTSTSSNQSHDRKATPVIMSKKNDNSKFQNAYDRKIYVALALKAPVNCFSWTGGGDGDILKCRE